MVKELNRNELLEFIIKMPEEEIEKCFPGRSMQSPWDVIKCIDSKEVEVLVSIYRNKISNGKFPLEIIIDNKYNTSIHCKTVLEAMDLLYQLAEAGYTWESGELLEPYRKILFAGVFCLSDRKTVVYRDDRHINAQYTFDEIAVKPSVTPEETALHISIAKEMSKEEFVECFKFPLTNVSEIENMEPHRLKCYIKNWKDKKSFQIGDVVRILDCEKLHLVDDISEDGFVCYVSDDLDVMYICFMGIHHPIKILYENRQYIKNTGKKVAIQEVQN